MSRIFIGVIASLLLCSAGCNEPQPQKAPRTSITFDMVGTGTITGTDVTGTINLSGMAVLDLVAGNLSYFYTDALTSINSETVSYNTSEEGVISGVWVEPSMSDPWGGSSEMTACSDLTGDSCVQLLSSVPETEFPILTVAASSVVESRIDFNMTGGETVLHLEYTLPTIDAIVVNLELTLTEHIDPVVIYLPDPVITPSNIDKPITADTVDLVLLDGQSNAVSQELVSAIKSGMTERTGRSAKVILCSVSSSNLQSHLLGGRYYSWCADKRKSYLSHDNYRLVGVMLVQGEANINDTPYIWSDLFKRYKNEVRADTQYASLPIVYSQLPNTTSRFYWAAQVNLFKSGQQSLSEELYGDNVRMVVTEHLYLLDGVHFHPYELPKLAELLVEQLYDLMLMEEAK